MVFLREGAQVEAWFGLFGDNANLKEILRSLFGDLAWNIPYAQKSIWTHLIELLDDVWR